MIRTAAAAWAQTPEAQRLLAAIADERPEPFWIKRHFGVNTVYPKYRGLAARALRDLWEAAREAAMDANDHDGFASISRAHPDDVILQRLNETAEQLTEVHGDPVPEAMRRVA